MGGCMHRLCMCIRKARSISCFGRESLKSADVPFHDLFQKLNVDRVAEDFQECAEIRYAFAGFDPGYGGMRQPAKGSEVPL